MTSEKKQKAKQGFIAGSLTSSAGVFISKLIGMFYIVPFKQIVGQANMGYYSAAYTYYNVLLQICSAGLPFAIAAMVAKYINKKDYKTALLVRRLSTAILMVSGFIMALIFILVSTPLARSVLGSHATAMDIEKMRNTFVILSLALFLIPIVYSYRGYYQGLKELKVYADSQIVEQFFRVFSLLAIGAIVVYIFHFDRIWGIYAAVMATSIGGMASLIHLMYFDHKHQPEIDEAAREQTTEPVNTHDIVREFIIFSIPYLLVSVLGNSQTLINTQFFIPVATSLGMKYKDALLIYGIIETNCDKLTSIPQVLSIGFSAGIVPYMTVSLENKDWKGLNRNIEDCLGTVLYIAVPICIAMASLAEPIYYVMYGGDELSYGTICLRWSSLLGFVTTLTPICNSMMLTLHFRKQSLTYLAIGFAVKCITFYPLMKFQGYTGAITSSVLCSLTIIFLSLHKIKKEFNIHYKRIMKRLLRILIACAFMVVVYALCKGFGPSMTGHGRVIALAELAVVGIAGILVYLWVSIKLRLPESIFHMNAKDMLRSILHKNGKKVSDEA